MLTEKNMLPVALGVVCLAAIAALAALRQRAPTAGYTGAEVIPITFLGYTNDSAGAKTARFAISNSTHVSLVPCGCAIFLRQSHKRDYYFRPYPGMRPLQPGRTDTVNLSADSIPEYEKWSVSFSFLQRGLRARWAGLRTKLNRLGFPINPGEFEFAFGCCYDPRP